MNRTLTPLSLALVLSACASLERPLPTPEVDAPAKVYAACPPLGDAKNVADVEAMKLRVAEVERWYEACRAGAIAAHTRPAWAPSFRLLPLPKS